MFWAVERGASVINMSFAGEEDTDLHEGVQRMASKDAVLVAANGSPDDATRNAVYPGAYQEVLTVGAVDRAGNVTGFSSANSHVDIVAPGVDMVSTGPAENDLYRTAQGTSDATAVVSGAAALVRAKFPNLSAAEVVHRLTATAIDKGPPGRDDQYGYGMLNIVGALTADVPPLAATVTPSPGADSGPDASPPSTKSSVSPVVWILGGGGLLLVAGVVFLLFALRRRSAS
jgi:subtilisin family serine protease